MAKDSKSDLTPWSIKGVSKKARTHAKKRAAEANMTMGEWLTRRIRESATGGE